VNCQAAICRFFDLKKTSNLVLVLSASARQNDRRRQSSFKYLQVVFASDSAGCGTALVSFLFLARARRVAGGLVSELPQAVSASPKVL
jgi:hypothetical protein